MRRFMIPILVCLLLTPITFGADDSPEPPVAPAVEEILQLQKELETKAAALAIERAALTKEKDATEFAKIAAESAKADADRTKAELATQQAAVLAEKTKLTAALIEVETEKGTLKTLRVEIDAEKAAVVAEQTRLAAFAAELENTQTTTGEAAEAIVAGPEEAEAGTLVVLDASGSKAAAFMWLADSLTDDQYDIDSSGKRLYFATPCEAGTYKFVLSVALDNSVDAVIHTVRVGEAPDPPDPDPPGPEPDPDLTGFPKEVYDWVIELVPAEAQVEPAAAFHDNYMAIASQIEAGALTDLEKVDWEITKLNRGAVDDETRELWLPWFEKLKERFVALEASSDLTTVQDASKLFQEIAEGLKEIK